MVFQRSDLEIVLQQILLAGELGEGSTPDVFLAAASGPGSITNGSDSSAASAEEARIVEALRDAILATNDLDFINSWLAQDIDELPTDEVASAALAWDLERVIAAARKIAIAAAKEPAGRTSAGEHAPLLLNAARAELAAENGNNALRPFASWAELLASLKQPVQVIELVARYGTHQALLAAATFAEKREIATLLVLGNVDLDGDGKIGANEIAPADRLDFMNAAGAYQGGTLGGLSNVEMKFAGVAAATSPVGSDFVFESEIETLQGAAEADGASDSSDAGQVTAISNGSSVILTGEDAGESAGSEGSTGDNGPTVDARQQFVRVGLDGRAVEDGGVGLTPLAGTDLVLVGTEAADVLAGGAGNDSIDGGAGNDKLSGGAGNDKISGGAGDDVVSGGDGDDQLQGGDGDDVILTGEGGDEADGGAGGDYILSDSDDTSISGGGGDDWVEGGGASVSGDSPGSDDEDGNDVIVLDAGSATGGGGADIFVSSGNGGNYQGGKGFDWVARSSIPTADHVDAYDGVEGLSGSGGDDSIQGDDRGSDQIATDGDALTDVTLISGLQAYLDESLGTSGASVFDGGNIILGGGGNDTIQGGGGNDIIDGDLALEVHILVDANGNGAADGGESSVSSLADLEQGILDGSIDAGHLKILREILIAGDDKDVDTAVFSGLLAEYDIAVEGRVTTVTHRMLDGDGGVIEGSIGADGIDRVTRIERLQFSDQMLIQTRVNGDTYVWQMPAALAVAIAEAIEDNSSDSGGGSSGDQKDKGGSSDLLDELAAAAADQDLGWLFDDDHGDNFDFSSLSAGDLGPATDTAILAGSSDSGSLDLSGIDWLLGSNGDMFVFASSDASSDVIDLADLPGVEDVSAIPLGAIDESYIGYQVEIVGVHDIMATDYAL